MEIDRILSERERTHGDWVLQSAFSQKLKHLVTSAEGLNASQKEALEMICVKISRICNGNANDPDHWKDIAGYATLAARAIDESTNSDSTNRERP